MFTYKARNNGGFHVHADDAYLGNVKKNENWTVRGTRIDWSAYRNGRYIGTESTRKGAAELLAATAKPNQQQTPPPTPQQ